MTLKTIIRTEIDSDQRRPVSNRRRVIHGKRGTGFSSRITIRLARFYRAMCPTSRPKPPLHVTPRRHITCRRPAIKKSRTPDRPNKRQPCQFYFHCFMFFYGHTGP
ncbi:hypothetical protein HPP92_021084 [Vanilla planifolia]|uniref:Uncharacterized protein n=1 Tax=Vanilla planifolia TaxID=51239 RepID=A0A835UIF9_VANPL|nr:hypothetical protein HPP92_021084 [Vanilla planifolia]